MSHPVPSAFLDPSCRAGIPHLKALRTVAQAPPRLVQPCPSPSSPNPPTDPPRPGIDHHDGHSRLPRAWDDSEGFLPRARWQVTRRRPACTASTDVRASRSDPGFEIYAGLPVTCRMASDENRLR